MGAPNPLQAILLQRMMQQIGQGGPGGPGGPAGPGGPGGPSPVPGAGIGSSGGISAGGDGTTVANPADQQADGLSKELSVMRVADPQMVSRELTSIKQRITTLINHTAMSLPGVARGLSKTYTGIDGAMKAAGEAATAQQVAGPPVQSGALPPGFPAGAGGDQSGGLS